MNSRLLIGFVVIAIITGFNAITHSENYSGTEIFDKYGFNFRYPGNFRAFEAGYPNFVDGASDFSGYFQANFEDGVNFEEILVIWSTVNEPKSLDEELHGVIDGMSEDVSVKQMGGKVKIYVGENCTAHYVYGELSQGGINFNGACPGADSSRETTENRYPRNFVANPILFVNITLSLPSDIVQKIF